MKLLRLLAVLPLVLAACGSDTKVGTKVKAGSGAQGGAIRQTPTPQPTPPPKGAATAAPQATARPTPKVTPPPEQAVGLDFVINVSGYEPSYLRVFPGTVIRATNKDKDPRSVTAEGGQFDSKLLQPNEVWVYKVDLPVGQYRFKDQTRPFVLGFLEVLPRTG